MHFEIPSGKKVYFVSDLHLGLPDASASLRREKLFCEWLDAIRTDASHLFIVGDLFDFWYEYKYVVPKGFVRTLGKLATLRDKGLPIYFFTGNHDQWMHDYFESELDIKVFRDVQHFTFNDKKFIVGHGDGLGPGDYSYKTLKKLFTNPLLRWCFSRLHPNFAIWLGNKWSKNNRLLNGTHEEQFLGEEKEWLIGYCRAILSNEHADYFIFGHRHLALDYTLNDKSRYINLGDWLTLYTYATFDGNNAELHYYK
jgi:UDP-2,3-diacylglucosamine hydrolase